MRATAGLVAAARLSWRAGPGICLTLAAITLVAGLLPAAITWSTKIVIDVIASGAGVTALSWPAIALAGAGLAMAAETHASRLLSSELARRVDRHAQAQLYGAVASFSGLSRFESPQFLDRLRMATHATGGAIAPATTGLFDIARSAIVLLSLLATLWTISPVMALVLVAAAVPALVAQLALSRRQLGMAMRLSPENRRRLFYTSLITDVCAAKEIRLLGLGGFLGDRLLTALTTIQRAERRMELQVTRVQLGLALVGAVISGLGLIWVVRSAGTGAFGPGDLSAFLASVAGVQGALAMLVTGVAAAHEALLVLRLHTDIVAMPDDLPSRSDRTALPALRTGIELRNVWFRYDGCDSWVLRGVDLTIPAGQSVAVVGANGAGKSTIVKLLCRFYDPDRGAILWDGVDIRDVPAAELRRRMGVLFQDFMSYDFTAAENIGLGDLPAMDDRDRIEHAAARAGIHEHVQTLRHGYDTLLSRLFLMNADHDDPETGAELSGGQWQRLALARTLMRGDRDLLVLDEPSAGMDAEAEYQVHRRLAEHRHGRTSVLVSHRLGSLRAADRIVVLAGGRVAEQGTHAQLVEAQGRYARMFSVQARGYDPVTAAQSVGSHLR